MEWCEVETKKASNMQRLCRWQTLGVRWQARIKRPCQKLAAPLSEFWLIGLSSLSDRGCFTQHSGEPYPCPFYSTPCQKKRTKKERSEYIAFESLRIKLESLFPRLSCLLSLSLSPYSKMILHQHSIHLAGGSNVSLCMCIGKQQTLQHEAFTEQVSVSVVCVCTSV